MDTALAEVSQDAPVNQAQPAESLTESGTQPPERTRYQRIGMEARMRVMELHADGLKATDITKITGIPHQRVCDITSTHGAIKDRVKYVLDAQRVKAAEAWGRAIPKAAKKGDHRPARELLIATGDVSPSESTGSGVTVVVNMPQESPRSVGSATTLEGVFVMPEDAE